MKKRMKIFIILLIVFLMPGCAKYSFEMEIKKDKSVNIQIISAVEEGYEDDSYIEDDRKAAISKNFNIRSYNDDEYVGYIFTKTYPNIDDISTENEITVELRDLLIKEKKEPKYYFQKKESLFKTTYIANFTLDISDANSSYLNSIEYKITLPTKVKNSNASTTSNNGKTLKWDLKTSKTNKIFFEYEEKNHLYTLVIAAITGIAITTLIFLKVTSKKIRNNNNNQNIYNNTNFYSQNGNQTNNTSNNIGNMDASEVSIKDNYINNMLPSQNVMYNNFNNNMFYSTGIIDTAYASNSQNNLYPYNNDYNNNNQNYANYQGNENNIDNMNNNQNNIYNNIDKDISSVDKPNLNNNFNINNVEEKRYELSSNKDIFN